VRSNVDIFPSINSISPTLIEVYTNNVSGAGVDRNFDLACSRQGTDYIKETDKVYTVPVDSLTGNYVRAEGNGGTVISQDITDIDFTLVSGNQVSWDGTSYMVQEEGSEITLSGIFRFNSNNQRIANLYKNGVKYKNIGTTNPVSSEHEFFYQGVKGEFSKNDTLSIRTQDNGGTLLNQAGTHYLNITESYGDRGIFLGTFGQPTCHVQNRATSNAPSSTNTSSVLSLTDTNGSCSFVSLASNQITLDAGTYEIKGFGQANGTSGTMMYLTDTAGTVIPPCVSNAFNTGSSILTHGSFGCQVTLSTSTTYEQREWTQAASVSGLCQIEHAGTGNAASYTVCNRLEITKVR
jgi:hypothetical protein